MLGASGAAGAFNHYYERDLDRLMRRTRARPFASGAFKPSPWWLVGFLALLAASLGARVGRPAGNVAAAFRVPRRLHLRHRLHGLAEAPQRLEHRGRRACRQLRGARRRGGRRSVAAGRADRAGGRAVPVDAAAFLEPRGRQGRGLRASAGVPMLPIVVPAYAWTLAILVHTVALVAVSLVPLWFGKGLFYGLGAGVGGGYFVWKSVAAVSRRRPRRTAMANFFASLLQLALLIAGVLLDGAVRHLVMTHAARCACVGARARLHAGVAPALAAASVGARLDPRKVIAQSEAGDRTKRSAIIR